MQNDPWVLGSPGEMAAALLCPVENIRVSWPKIFEQFGHAGLQDRKVLAWAAANIATETAHQFMPVREAFWMSEDWRRSNLDYYPYYGRGHLQCTWASNYRRYSERIAALWGTSPDQQTFQFMRNPDLLLDPDLSAAFVACYFKDHPTNDANRIPKSVQVDDLQEARRLIVGGDGTRGLDEIVAAYRRLTNSIGGDIDDSSWVFPVEGYTGEVNLHWGSHIGGSDIFAARGTPVLAVHGGIVSYRATTGIGGNAVQIDSEQGLESYYAHGDRPPMVQVGDRIDAGHHLFGVGDTGNATQAGPHLHFGMGFGIQSGSGAQGGCGADYDAVSTLRRLQTRPGAKPAEPASELWGHKIAIAHLSDVVVPMMRDNPSGALAEAKRIREQFVGVKP